VVSNCQWRGRLSGGEVDGGVRLGDTVDVGGDAWLSRMEPVVKKMVMENL